MSDPLVVVSASLDRTACLGLAERLSRAGIPAVVARCPDSFPLGVPRFAVSVPESAAAHAAHHVASWSGTPLDEGPYRTASTEAASELADERPTRPRRLGAFFAFGLGFGLGHVYAREYVAALVLALGQLACIALAATGTAEMLLALPGLLALDAWGAWNAVERENRGMDREPAASQLATTLPCVALVLASASLLADPPQVRGTDGRQAPVATAGPLR